MSNMKPENRQYTMTKRKRN